MQNQLTTQSKQSALAVMAGKFSVEPDKLLNTLKQTVFKGATNEELLALVVVANQYGLNPLTKELYAFPAKGGGIVPVVSVDGWLRMMNDHPQFDGIEHQDEHNEKGELVSCTAIIHRKDRNHPTKVTEYLAECQRATDPWKMKHRMLRHKATIQCARVAFGFSGIMDEDEGREVSERDVTPKPAARTARSQPLNPFVPAEPPADMFAAEVPEKSALDAVKEKLAETKLDWLAINRVMLDNGLFDDTRNNPDDCTDDELRSVLSQWTIIEKEVAK